MWETSWLFSCGFPSPDFQSPCEEKLWSLSFLATPAICSTPCTAVKLLHICYAELCLLFSVWIWVCKWLHGSYLYWTLQGGKYSHMAVWCLVQQWLLVVRWYTGVRLAVKKKKLPNFSTIPALFLIHSKTRKPQAHKKRMCSIYTMHVKTTRKATRKPQHHQGAAESSQPAAVDIRVSLDLMGRWTGWGWERWVTGVRDWKGEGKKTSNWDQRQASRCSLNYETRRRYI